MSVRARKSLWLGLLKEIRFGPVPDDGWSSSFFAGLDPRAVFSGGLVVHWWHTALGQRLAHQLAVVYIESATKRRHYEIDLVAGLLFDVLKERCLDGATFSGVFGARSGSLVDRLAAVPGEVASRLDVWMLQKLEEDVGEWTLIYPLFRVFGPTTDFGFERLTVADPADKTYWSALDHRGIFGRDWYPHTGQFWSGGGFQQDVFHAWLVGRYLGSKEAARNAFRRDAQEAMAALYAFWSRDYIRRRVLKDADTTCFLVGNIGGQYKLELSVLGLIYPCYGDELHTSALVQDVHDWNRRRRALTPERRQRLGTALCFANLAMCSTDIPVYTNYFIALDALFGMRGHVEDSITDGVAKISRLPQATEKIVWLFDLRNELLHGGSRHIHEWHRYPDYLKHFDTDPAKDMELMALDCIRRYPDEPENRQAGAV